MDGDLRRAVMDAAVAPELTAPMLAALGLPADFPDRAQRAGLVLRPARPGLAMGVPSAAAGVPAGPPESRAVSRPSSRGLHARVAGVLAAAGRRREAVDHWLDAGEWREALDAGGRPRARAATDVACPGPWMAATGCRSRPGTTRTRIWYSGSSSGASGTTNWRHPVAARGRHGVRRPRPAAQRMARPLDPVRRAVLDRRVRRDRAAGRGLGRPRPGPARIAAQGRGLVRGVRADVTRARRARPSRC